MFLATLMILSVLPLGQIQINSTPDSAEKIQTQTTDLSDETVTNLAEGRQSGPATAHWDFDTTSFSMMATSTTNAGIDGIEYHPCEAAWGWRDDAGTGVYNSQIPHLQWYFGAAVGANPYNAPQTYHNAELDCHSWDDGMAMHGYSSEFVVTTGDGTTEYAPEHTSHDVGRYASHAQWLEGTNVFYNDATYQGLYSADNILDFDVDNSGNTYVVGSWDGNRLVFPNVVGTHVYLDNSGKNGNGPDMQIHASYHTIDENHDKDIFVAKMDANGVWLWANSMHHYGVETASSIAVTNQGEVYIGGTIACEEVGTTAFFPDQAGAGADASGISLSCTDSEPVGFVARLNTNGGFTHAKKVENVESFSSVTDIAIDPRADDTLYYIGQMGYCEVKDCPAADSYMVGKMMTDNSLNPPPWGLEWVDFVDGFTMTEIEMTANGAIITGFTESDATIGSVSISENKIVVARVASQTTTSSVTWDWAKSCTPQTTADDWKDWLEGNPSWGLSVGDNIAMLVEPGSQCGAMESNFFGFQAVSMDLDGNWLWSNGDRKDTTNVPAYLQFSDDAHATDLDYSNNGDVVISVNLGKMVMINGSNFIPQNGLSDMLLLRLDDDTGTKIWHHQEINSECDSPGYGYKLTSTNSCPENMRGGADARRIVVKNLDDIYMSGMIYGKEIYLHDGLPEHCDYDYARPYWQDINGQYEPVPSDLQGSRGGDMSYFTKCVDSTMWETASNDTMPANYENIYPQHGTQWHGGNPYFAKFDACPRAQGVIVAEPIDVATSGRTDWYVSPVGEPLSVDNTRYDCDPNGTYSDPQPVIDIVGCMDVYAMNYDPYATIPCTDCCEYDGSPPAPGTGGIEPCNCVPKESIVNMTKSDDLKSINIMEITAPKSAGSPQGSNAGFYHMEYAADTETAPGGILAQTLSDSDMETGICDLRTSARECYDFYISDEYGNLDTNGKFIAIRTYNEILHAGNIDAVWLTMSNGDEYYAVDIVYFDHGNAPPGTSHEYEILGAPSNDPSINPIVTPIQGFTKLGPQYTTIVLCFDTAPKPVDNTHEHSDGTTHSHENGNKEHSHEEKEECETCDEESTLPSISLLATLGVTMLALYVSRRKEV